MTEANTIKEHLRQQGELPRRVRWWRRRRGAIASKVRGWSNRLEAWVEPPKLVLTIGAGSDDLREVDGLDCGHMGGPRPEIGQGELLVYGDCACGWRMGAPEGALWPYCPNCGAQVLPPSSERAFAGEVTRLGYVAMLLPEGEAVAAIRQGPRVA